MQAKASQLCKGASGPVRVKLTLKDDRTVYDVFVGGAGEIVKDAGRSVFTKQDLRFRPADIVDVVTF